MGFYRKCFEIRRMVKARANSVHCMQGRFKVGRETYPGIFIYIYIYIIKHFNLPKKNPKF